MNTSIRAGKTKSTKELKVMAHFSNGFAETVYELSDGTLIFISYHNDRVRIVERELLSEDFTEQAIQIQNIINSTEAEA